MNPKEADVFFLMMITIAQIAVMTQTGDYDICFVNSSGSEVFNMCRQSIAGLKSIEVDTKDKVKE